MVLTNYPAAEGRGAEESAGESDDQRGDGGGGEGGGGGGGRARIPFRYVMAIMGSIGLAIIYGFKVNVSVAIVAMVNHTAIKVPAAGKTENASVVCYRGGDDSTLANSSTAVSEDGPFEWDEPLQGLILSAYFWGYMASLLPAGRMSELLSAKWVMNGSVLLNVLASMLSPVAAELHYSVFIVMRFVQGIGGGVSFPAMHVMIAKWAPPNERSVIASIVYAGTALGTVISILLSGMIAARLGWQWIFYIEGALCLIWSAAWWLTIADSPAEQKRFIAQREKMYIMEALGCSKSAGTTNKRPQPVPWGRIFRSKPFIAILIAHFCNNFGWYMLLIELPTFMNQILRFDMKSNAGVSSVPFLCMWLFTMILSKVLAVCQDKKWISVTLSRKIGTWISSFVPMICLIAVSYVGCNRTLAVTLMTIGVTCIGGMFCGFLSNHIDIAPNFAGTLVAITNFVATVPGFVVPIFVGKLTHGNQNIGAWRIIFSVTAALYVVEILIYSVFGSGEEQPWNKMTASDKDEERNGQSLPLKTNEPK